MYNSVVEIEAWPSNCWMYRMSVPDSSRCVAKLCLSVWGWTSFFICALCAHFCTIFWRFLVVNCPFGPEKRYI